MIAYLSGAMEHAQNEGAEWRSSLSQWLEEELDHSGVDPVKATMQLVSEHSAQNYRDWKKNDPQRFKAFIRHCIKNDLNLLLNKSDYLICLWDANVIKGGGTHGEITMAYHNNIPVYLVNKIPEVELSGWIIGCTTEIFIDVAELKRRLLELYGKK